MINVEKIRAALLDFWTDSLEINCEESAIHIAYPLLLPDGWQLSFSIYFDELNNIYELSDNRRTWGYLEQYFNHMPAINNQIIAEKCDFYGIQRTTGNCFCKLSINAISPVEIQLFAEGLLAIYYLIYRYEKRSSWDRAPYEAVRQILISNHIPLEEDVILHGRSHSRIRADFKSGNAVFRVVNNRDPLSALQITCFQFHDYKLENSDARRALIYNPDRKWDTDCQALADSKDYFEFAADYNDTEKITWFVKNGSVK